MELMTMESLFQKAGLNWETMDKNTPYDVSNLGIRIKSYNHEKRCVEMRKILHLVRKEDSNIYNLVTKSGDVLLKCSGNHKIWDSAANKYFNISQIESGNAMNQNGEMIEFFVKKTNEIAPIVDMQVEGNSNYFTNGLLSHNTTSGGKALLYYASIRLKFTRIGKVEEKNANEKLATAIETKVETVKNKTFAPFKTATIQIAFGKGIDNDAGILDTALDKGVVVRRGGNYYYNEQKVALGLPALKEYLENNPSVFEEIKAKVKSVLENEKQEQVADDGAEPEISDDEIANAIENDETTEVGEV